MRCSQAGDPAARSHASDPCPVWPSRELSFEREELQHARDRANQLGISLAEYVRRLVAEDLGESARGASAVEVFDLGGSSGGSNIALDKDAMIAEAFSATRR